MLVLNLPFKALMFRTLLRPSLVLFLVLWLKLVKDFLRVRFRLALLPVLISCVLWLDLVASLPLIKERILVIILLLHFLSLMLVRFESSSVPTTLPTAYDVYPLDGRHDGGYYTVKDCVTIDVLPRTPGNNVYVGFMVWSNFTATKCRGLV